MSKWIPTSGARARARLEDVVVVDVDVHVHDTAKLIARHCSPPWRRVLEEEQAVAPFGRGTRSFPVFPGRSTPAKTQPAEELRTSLDDLSIDIGVLFPDRVLSLGWQPNPEFAMELARAYNRWIADEYLSGTRGLYGVICVAPQDPQASVGEIERYAGEERWVGVMLPSTRLDPMWGHRMFDPIYRAAEEAGLTLFFHGGNPVQIPMLPFDLRQFDTQLMNHTYTHSVLMMSTLANLFSTGMPIRFPRLKMIFIEAGISWVPHIMLRLDRVWEQRRDDLPFIEDRPSEYMRRQMYYATQPIEEPEDLRDMVEVIRVIGGHNTVLFASDFPHHDFDHPKKVFDIPVPVEVKRRIMGENALQLLGIPTPTAAECVPGKTLARSA